MPRIFIGIALLLCSCSLWGQFDFGVRAGGLYGGPIPTKIDPDSSDGRPGTGLSAAVWASYEISDRVRVRAELGYAWKGADYSLLIRTDTNVTLELLPGVVDTVPSFYFADVTGSMSLHYLELPIFLQYETLPGLSLDAGINLGFLLGGSDEGTAEIQIGEGGIFEDTLTSFQNYPVDLQSFDFGLLLGATYDFDFGLQLQLRGYRSIRGLYRKGFFDEQGLDGNRMYHTQFYLGAGWRF